MKWKFGETWVVNNAVGVSVYEMGIGSFPETVVMPRQSLQLQMFSFELGLGGFLLKFMKERLPLRP